MRISLSAQVPAWAQLRRPIADRPLAEQMTIDLSHTVNPDQATSLGFGLEGIFYGIHIVFFSAAVVLFVSRQTLKQPTARPILVATLLLFALCTLHFALNFQNVYVSTMVKVRPHISAETPRLVAADTSFILADFIGQLVLIYRCYLIWACNGLIILLPTLLALASVSCGMAVTGIVQRISPTAEQVPASLVPMGDATFSLSIICNFITTGLIVARLWWVSRRTEGDTSRNLSPSQRATAIFVESGLLFFVTQFVFIVLFAIAHPAQAIVEPIAIQVYAISPLLILIRIALGKSYENAALDSQQPASPDAADGSKAPFSYQLGPYSSDPFV
ncbi:unnamed protein product [Mycena citricolor]|uniref:Uncharacterized protein n=1 Tax=Mycena citricolor TaxID=2018698 RepID=A0AAD2H194_9AGAR|nr:unnamed protein product [Mycena citricolor]